VAFVAWDDFPHIRFSRFSRNTAITEVNFFLAGRMISPHFSDSFPNAFNTGSTRGTLSFVRRLQMFEMGKVIAVARQVEKFFGEERARTAKFP
jgi:hypothetical protein